MPSVESGSGTMLSLRVDEEGREASILDRDSDAQVDPSSISWSSTSISNQKIDCYPSKRTDK